MTKLKLCAALLGSFAGIIWGEMDGLLTALIIFVIIVNIDIS